MMTRDTRSLPEDGFHEIQLSGKQLVFLFMATTVVSVVIFLCGVLVGRGVRTEASAAGLLPSAEGAATTPPAGTPAEAGGSQAAGPGAAPAGGDEIDYHRQLTAAQASEPAVPVDETSEPPAEPPPTVSRSQDTAPASAPEATRAEPAPPVEATAPPASTPGNRLVVQVTALRNKREAEAVAARLARRGYNAFVLDPQPGGAPFFRVRVGPFGDRAAADQAVQRLTREEKFKPWIAR